MSRTWVNGSPPFLNADNLNALEADVTTALGVPDAALAARVVTGATATALNATYGPRSTFAALSTAAALTLSPGSFDQVDATSGSRIRSLAAGTNVGDEITVKVSALTSPNTVIVQGDTGVTAVSVTLTSVNQAVTSVWDGSKWVIKSRDVPKGYLDANTVALLANRDEINVLDWGVTTGTSTSQTTALNAVCAANPGKGLLFPPGDYRLDATWNITTNNNIRLASGARIYAGAAMDSLINYDNGQAAADNFSWDKQIVGPGMLDGALLANKVLTIASVLRFALEGFTVKDGIYRGILTKSLGAEILARNLRIYNSGATNSHKSATLTTTSGSATVTAAGGTFASGDVGSPIIASGIPVGATITGFTDSGTVTISANATASASVSGSVLTNIGIESNMGDCQWDDVIIRDTTVGLWDKASNLWTAIHPWLGTTAQLTARYPVSVAFLVAGASKFVLPTADSYRYAFRSASPTGYSTMRLIHGRCTVNSGQLTTGLAAASPGVIFDLQDGGVVHTVAGSWQGHPTTPHAFLAGSTIRFNAINNNDSNPGSVTGLSDYKRGVKMGTTSFAGTLFGATAGSVSLSTNSCQMEVRDGIVVYSFVLVGTGTADLAGVLWLGGMPLPSGATATSTGSGPINYAIGADANSVIGANGTASPLTARIEKNSGGNTTQISGTPLASQAVQIWGSIMCAFTYPS
ncbi:hypothetical protein AB4Z38_07165 [Arthrobacter sp. 2RAF6]|uniref:hypothetical protein n=1 Tax=Arthrobacter sp. 2RAF6 TaxID=3233002 RepID=UPI003F8EF95E